MYHYCKSTYQLQIIHDYYCYIDYHLSESCTAFIAHKNNLGVQLGEDQVGPGRKQIIIFVSYFVCVGVELPNYTFDSTTLHCKVGWAGAGKNCFIYCLGIQ